MLYIHIYIYIYIYIVRELSAKAPAHGVAELAVGVGTYCSQYS